MDRIFKMCQLWAVFYLFVLTAAVPPTEQDIDALIKEIFNVPSDEPVSTATEATHTIPPTFQPDTRYPNHPPPPHNEDAHTTYPQPQPQPQPQPHLPEVTSAPVPISNTNAENEPNVGRFHFKLYYIQLLIYDRLDFFLREIFSLA